MANAGVVVPPLLLLVALVPAAPALGLKLLLPNPDPAVEEVAVVAAVEAVVLCVLLWIKVSSECCCCSYSCQD